MIPTRALVVLAFLPILLGILAVVVGLHPVRLPRGRETSLADGFDNLYPLGEGAGYAGGIMSSAIDGARAAKRYCNR